MRVLICGGDNIHDKNKFFKALDKLNSYSYIKTIITENTGVSNIYLRQWAKMNRCEMHIILKSSEETNIMTETLHGQTMIDLGTPDLIVLIGDNEKVGIMRRLAIKRGITHLELEI